MSGSEFLPNIENDISIDDISLQGLLDEKNADSKISETDEKCTVDRITEEPINNGKFSVSEIDEDDKKSANNESYTIGDIDKFTGLPNNYKSEFVEIDKKTIYIKKTYIIRTKPEIKNNNDFLKFWIDLQNDIAIVKTDDDKIRKELQEINNHLLYREVYDILNSNFLIYDIVHVTHGIANRIMEISNGDIIMDMDNFTHNFPIDGFQALLLIFSSKNLRKDEVREIYIKENVQSFDKTTYSLPCREKKEMPNLLLGHKVYINTNIIKQKRYRFNRNMLNFINKNQIDPNYDWYILISNITKILSIYTNYEHTNYFDEEKYEEKYENKTESGEFLYATDKIEIITNFSAINVIIGNIIKITDSSISGYMDRKKFYDDGESLYNMIYNYNVRTFHRPGIEYYKKEKIIHEHRNIIIERRNGIYTKYCDQKLCKMGSNIIKICNITKKYTKKYNDLNLDVFFSKEKLKSAWEIFNKLRRKLVNLEDHMRVLYNIYGKEKIDFFEFIKEEDIKNEEVKSEEKININNVIFNIKSNNSTYENEIGKFGEIIVKHTYLFAWYEGDCKKYDVFTDVKFQLYKTTENSSLTNEIKIDTTSKNDLLNHDNTKFADIAKCLVTVEVNSKYYVIKTEAILCRVCSEGSLNHCMKCNKVHGYVCTKDEKNNSAYQPKYVVNTCRHDGTAPEEDKTIPHGLTLFESKHEKNINKFGNYASHFAAGFTFLVALTGILLGGNWLYFNIGVIILSALVALTFMYHDKHVEYAFSDKFLSESSNHEEHPTFYEIMMLIHTKSDNNTNQIFCTRMERPKEVPDNKNVAVVVDVKCDEKQKNIEVATENILCEIQPYTAIEAKYILIILLLAAIVSFVLYMVYGYRRQEPEKYIPVILAKVAAIFTIAQRLISSLIHGVGVFSFSGLSEKTKEKIHEFKQKYYELNYKV